METYSFLVKESRLSIFAVSSESVAVSLTESTMSVSRSVSRSVTVPETTMSTIAMSAVSTCSKSSAGNAVPVSSASSAAYLLVSNLVHPQLALGIVGPHTLLVMAVNIERNAM